MTSATLDLAKFRGTRLDRNSAVDSGVHPVIAITGVKSLQTRSADYFLFALEQP